MTRPFGRIGDDPHFSLRCFAYSRIQASLVHLPNPIYLGTDKFIVYFDKVFSPVCKYIALN